MEQALRASPAIRFVAVEFETGNKAPTEGRKVIDHLADIQDALDRRLHPLVIGGTQFVESIAVRFDQATFIDSTPFVKAVHRQLISLQEGFPIWKANPTPEGEGVEAILAHNLTGYSAWINQRWQAKGGRARSPRPARPRPVRIPLPLHNGYAQRPPEATLFPDMSGGVCKQRR
jgi:hypothetical protein